MSDARWVGKRGTNGYRLPALTLDFLLGPGGMHFLVTRMQTAYEVNGPVKRPVTLADVESAGEFQLELRQ